MEILHMSKGEFIPLLPPTHFSVYSHPNSEQHHSSFKSQSEMVQSSCSLPSLLLSLPAGPVGFIPLT